MYVVSAMCVLNDDIADNSKEDLERPTKCQCHNYDHSHTKAAVWNDYLSHSSFRKNCVSKAIYKTIRSAVLKHNFSKKEFDCCGRETIGVSLKLLMALKVNMYGVAANAFCNYFQMGKSTACKCC